MGVPGSQLCGGRMRRTDRGDLAEEHSARAGDRVLHLAALAHDAGDLVADALLRGRLRLAELSEGGGVDRERTHGDGDLVLERPRGRVEPAGHLRQDTGRIERAMEAEGMRRGHGTSATIRRGPPEPPAIFIGRATTHAPHSGSSSSRARFSRPKTSAPLAMTWTMKSLDAP